MHAKRIYKKRKMTISDPEHIIIIAFTVSLHLQDKEDIVQTMPIFAAIIKPIGPTGIETNTSAIRRVGFFELYAR